MWQKVFPGQPIIKSASRENAITDLLNGAALMNEQSIPEQTWYGVAMQCYVTAELAAFMPVEIQKETDDYCAASPSPKPGSLWGLTTEEMPEDSIGLIILQGKTKANILLSDVEHRFAKLKEGKLVSCEEQTSCRILSTAEETGDQLCTVFLGEQQSTAPQIPTEFAVTLEEDNTLSITGGYLNRNGTLLSIEGKKQITPQNGTLCLRSVMEEKTEGSQWTAPEFVFCDVACNAWPVADVVVKENEDGTKKITVRQRITNVAIILQTKPCPLTTVGALKQ